MKLLTKKSKALLKSFSKPKEEVEKSTKKHTKSHTDNKLPSDDYKDLIPPAEIKLDDNGKLVISVKRGGEFGLPRVDIRFFATTDVYTGFTKKGVNFDLGVLPELNTLLAEVEEICSDKGFFEEFEDEETEEE